MKKLISIILCIFLMVSTVVPYASSSNATNLSTIAEQSPVDNTRSDLIVTDYFGTNITPANGTYSQSGTVGTAENKAMNFKFVENSVENINNRIYTTSFNIHDDMGADVTVNLIRKTGEGKHVLTFKKLETGVKIYDAPSGNKNYIVSNFANGKAPCTIVYNAITKVLTAQAGTETLTIENVETEAEGEFTRLRCKIASSSNTEVPEKFTVSDVAMKMEQISEPEETGPIAENNNITALATGDLQVIHWNPGNIETHTMTSDGGKFTLTANGSGNRSIMLGLPKDSELKNNVDMTKIVYTASFKLHREERGGDFTIQVLGYHNDNSESTGVVLLKDETSDGKLSFNIPQGIGAADWNQDGTVDCILTYNANTKVSTVKIGETEISKTLTGNYKASNAAAAYGFGIKGPANVDTTISISDVSLKMEDADSTVPPAGDGDDDNGDNSGNDDNNDEPEETGPIAENNNITAAASGDLQVIHWNPGNIETHTMTSVGGKFTLTANGSGNRSIMLGLPKDSELKDTTDMKKVVYTASFKLHRQDRGGDFTIQVLGYHNDNSESTGVTFKNEEKDGMLWVTSSGGSDTANWDQDDTVDCTITYNAETKMVTVKVGEIKLSKTLTGDYNASNAAAAYGFGIKGPANVDTTITISDVSLKLEKAVAPPPSVDVDGVKGKEFNADLDRENPAAVNGANGFSFCGRVNGVDTKMIRVEQLVSATTGKRYYGWASATDADARYTYNGPQAIPTDNTAAVIIFDAPGSGFAQITVPTIYLSNSSSQGKITVELNGKSLWTHTFLKKNTTTTIDFTMYLNKGDKLAFVMERVGGTTFVISTLPKVRYLTDSDIADASLADDGVKTSYNAKTDYAKMHNVEGLTNWSYVTKTEGAYNAMYYNNTFLRWVPIEKTDSNTEYKGGIAKGKAMVPNGAFAYAWTADKSGVVKLSSDVGVTSDKDVNVKVFKNGNEMLWTKDVTAGADADTTLDKTIQVEAGDTIYFEVQNDGDDLANVFWTPQVEYIQTAVFIQDGTQLDEIKDLDESKEISCYYVDSDKTAGKAIFVAYDSKGTAVGIKEQAATFTAENVIELTFPAFGEGVDASRAALIILTNADGRYYAVNKTFNLIID